MLAEPLASVMGNPVVVENRPGAGMLLGTEAAAKAEADGYTILLGREAQHRIQRRPLRQAAVRPEAPISCRWASRASIRTRWSRATTCRSARCRKSWISRAPIRASSRTRARATAPGSTSPPRSLFHLAGVQVTHVPYKGAAPAYQDLIPGRVDLFFDNSATAQPHIEARRVKPIAVSSAERLAVAARTCRRCARAAWTSTTRPGSAISCAPARRRRSSRGCARISTRCSRCRRSPPAWRSAGTARRAFGQGHRSHGR